jgi:aldehyde dehydrogenase (NAD+)
MVLGIGPKAGELLVSHPRISLISFTGSTAVGRRIGSIAGSNLKKVSLELGGKNAGIVFPSVDFNEVMAPLIR